MLVFILTKTVWAVVYMAVGFSLDLPYNAEGAMTYNNLLTNFDI